MRELRHRAKWRTAPTLVRMWQVISSRIAYENPWIQVVEDRVIGPDGAPGLYGVVEVRNPAVFIVAVNDAGEVLFESVDRHTVGLSLEVPAGGNDGEDFLVAAKRELYEETGYVAERWQPIGSMWALNGICRAPGTCSSRKGSAVRPTVPMPMPKGSATSAGCPGPRCSTWSRPASSRTARPWLL